VEWVAWHVPLLGSKNSSSNEAMLFNKCRTREEKDRVFFRCKRNAQTQRLEMQAGARGDMQQGQKVHVEKSGRSRMSTIEAFKEEIKVMRVFA
jgi:hypothetical protein